METDFKVERIMAERKKGHRTEYFVLFEGYGSESAEWLDSDNVGDGIIRHASHIASGK